MSHLSKQDAPSDPPPLTLPLPDDSPRGQLYRILRRAWHNLSSELSKCDPKSIWTKARDILHNVSFWQSHVEGRSALREMNLSDEYDVCYEMLTLAQETAAALSLQVDANVRSSGLAQEHWGTLLRTTGAALGRLAGEFRSANDVAANSVIKSGHLALGDVQ